MLKKFECNNSEVVFPVEIHATWTIIPKFRVENVRIYFCSQGAYWFALMREGTPCVNIVLQQKTTKGRM